MAVRETPPGKEIKRKRYAPKVRSGCSSCKKCKVKCNEQRPNCGRCVRLGFACEYQVPETWVFEPSKKKSGIKFQVKGSALNPEKQTGLQFVQDFRNRARLVSSTLLDYQEPNNNGTGTARNPQSKTISPSQRRIVPDYKAIPTLGITWDEAETARSMHYYLQKTAPLMALDGDPYLFTVVVPQRSWYLPAVKHAVVAASMISESAKDLRGAAAPLTHRAAQHYSKAVSEFVRSPPSTEVALILCAMLVTYERYNNNAKLALLHMDNAAKMLLQWQSNERGKDTHADELIEMYIAPAFRRCFQYAGLDRELGSPFHRALTGQRVSALPPSFPSFEDTCDRLATCINMLCLWKADYSCTHDFSGIRVQLDEWLEEFKVYKGSGWPCERLLQHVHYQVALALLGLQQGLKPGENEMVNLDKIVEQMDYLLSSSSIQSSENFRSRLGIIPPLFFAAVESDKVKTTSRAIQLLRTIDRFEGQWSSIQAADIAQHVVDTQEDRLEAAKGLTDALGAPNDLSYLTKNYGYQSCYRQLSVSRQRTVISGRLPHDTLPRIRLLKHGIADPLWISLDKPARSALL